MTTNLTDKFNEYRNALLADINNAILANEGVIKLNVLVGGKNEENFSRRTLLHRVFIQSDFFDGDKPMLELKDGNSLTALPLSELNPNELQALCEAIDQASIIVQP